MSVVKLAKPLVNEQLVETFRKGLEMAERGEITSGMACGLKPDGAAWTSIPHAEKAMPLLGVGYAMLHDLLASCPKLPDK